MLLWQPFEVDWETVNKAILERWFRSGLEYIKRKAWKLYWEEEKRRRDNEFLEAIEHAHRYEKETIVSRLAERLYEKRTELVNLKLDEVKDIAKRLLEEIEDESFVNDVHDLAEAGE